LNILLVNKLAGVGMSREYHGSLKVVLIATVITMLVSVFPGPVMAADNEPNDTYENAEPITVGQYQGHVNNTDKDDIYVIDLVAGQTVFVRAEPDSKLGVNLYLYLKIGENAPDEVDSHVAPLVGESKGAPRYTNYTVSSIQDEYDMFIIVSREKGEGNYTIVITLFSQNDAASGGDAGDDFESDLEIFEDEFDAFLKEGDNDDYYLIRAEPGDIIFVDGVPEDSMALDLQLYQARPRQYDVEYVEVAKDKSPGKDEGFGDPRHIEFVLVNEEVYTTYFLRAHRGSGYGNYTFTVSFFHQNDCGSGTDAPAGKVNASEPGAGNHTGHLRSLDNSDYFLFNLTDRQGLNVSVTPDDILAVNVEIFEEVETGGSTTLVSRAKVEAPGEGLGLGMERSVNYTIPKMPYSRLYVEVTPKEGLGNYTMDITIVPKPPDITPPTIIVIEPVEGTKFTKSKEIAIRGTAYDDDSGTVEVWLSLDNNTWTKADGTDVWNTTLKLRKGNNTILVKATDAVGNQVMIETSVRYRKEETDPAFESVAILMAFMVAMIVMIRRRR
jgi:hypothetical protein